MELIYLYQKNCQKKIIKQQKNTYDDALVNGLYDIYNDSIIDLYLSNTKNERKSYCEQFSSLKENDIVIHFKLCL